MIATKNLLNLSPPLHLNPFFPMRRTIPFSCSSSLTLCSSRRKRFYFHDRVVSAPGNQVRRPFYTSSSVGLAAAAANTTDSDSNSDSDTVEKLLMEPARVQKMMKMERKSDGESEEEVEGWGRRKRWFPYLNSCRCAGLEVSLDSREVIEALEGYIMDVRKEKMKRVVEHRSYSVSLVVEGLTDYGNVSAAFRSADALGVQSVHVISRDNRKRYRDNRHVSRGAEKWLDIELWKSPAECFKTLKSRGYRIATTHFRTDTVSIYDMDWSLPTAIVVGNEQKGISDEALELSDLHCCIPMNGMVDSFNVSVAAGILMHHAVCDRISRMGSHGDLTDEESRILLAEFYLRHKDGIIDVVKEYGNRKLKNFLL